MSLELGDLIQLVDRQLFGGQEMLNVFYYRCTDVGTPATDYLEQLNTAFMTDVMVEILQIQSTNLDHMSREWRNLSNGIDFFTDTEIVPGVWATPTNGSLPSFVSATFKLSRSTLVVRNGSKRFAGLSEDQVNGNSWQGSTAPLTAIAAALPLVLTDPLIGFEFEPVIVKRPIPPAGVSAITSKIAGASFSGIGTQNSRKD